MKFDGGKSSVSTYSGMLVSFILFIVFMGYSAEKFKDFITKSNSNISIAVS